MHINLRRYPVIGVDRDVVEKSVSDELLPALKALPGVEAYVAFWDGSGAGVSVSGAADAEAAYRSTNAARQWLAGHLDFFPRRGDEFSGECFVREEAPRRASPGEPLPYVLVRVLAGVPATQDTRAFVEQRTLPMIARSPGFRAVWMARSDREPDQAVVATFFDTPDEALACHEAAVALLREGLPTVSLTQLLHGRAVIASVA
ncbi:hypothetical protein [Falsiroseomonas sp. HW251]|uniref:hypothetical protein n=1 Tax=Falsiroseomonas sp. HW251 TaxID=3390998 RepID=UPI003D321C33